MQALRAKTIFMKWSLSKLILQVVSMISYSSIHQKLKKQLSIIQSNIFGFIKDGSQSGHTNEES